MTDGGACLLTPRLRLRPLQPATELVRAALDHAFSPLALAEVDAYAMAENGASVRVLQKCGFVFLRHEPALQRQRFRVRRPQRVLA